MTGQHILFPQTEYQWFWQNCERLLFNVKNNNNDYYDDGDVMIMDYILAVKYTSLLLYAVVLGLVVQLQLLSHNFSGHQIEETLRAAGKSHLFTRLSYPGAGHLIEPPYSPNSRSSLWSVKPKKRELYPRITFWACQDHTVYLLHFNCETLDCNIKYLLLCEVKITKMPPVLFLLQSSLCGEVTSHPTLLPRKMPGRKSWIVWKLIWGDEFLFYFRTACFGF